MLNVALTGNVAAGKSTVLRHFAEWGATVIDADALVREVQQPGSPTLAAIVAHFGPAVLAADGTLDRDVMRQHVFADPQARAALEAIVHPAVRRRRDELAARAAARGDAILVNDIPLLFETLDPSHFDLVVLVDAPQATRRRRLIEARNLTADEADRLMAAQMPSAEKRARSDLLIENDASLEVLEDRARDAWNAMQQMAQNRS